MNAVRSWRLGSVGLSALVRVGTFPVTALATFLTTSLVIGHAGAAGYAAIAVVITLSQLVPYADLGIGAGVINAISMSEVDDPIRTKAVASAIRVMLVSMILVSSLGLLGMTFFSWSEVLSLENSGLARLDTVTALVIVIFAATIPMGIGQRVLLALMMNPIAIVVNSLGPILSLLGTAVIVGMGLSPELLVFPPVVGGLISSFVSLWIATKRIRFRWLTVFQYRKFHLPGLLSQGMWYLMISVVSAFAFQWGRIVLASRGTLDQVATYSIAMQFYAPLWSFFIAAGTSLWPIFARNRSRNESNSALLLRMVLYFAGAGLVCLIGLMLFGPWLAGVISHSAVEASAMIFLGCGLLIIVQSVQLVLGVSLTSPRDLRFQALWGIPMAASVIGATWLFVPALGAITPFLAAGVGVLLFQVFPNVFRVRANSRSLRDTTANPELETVA